MGTRLQLHEELLELAPRAYYQPPETVRMEYPCFRYALVPDSVIHADNKVYQNFTKYSVTYISRTHAEEIIKQMRDRFVYCRFDRPYTSDNLYHYNFELYY